MSLCVVRSHRLIHPSTNQVSDLTTPLSSYTVMHSVCAGFLFVFSGYLRGPCCFSFILAWSSHSPGCVPPWLVDGDASILRRVYHATRTIRALQYTDCHRWRSKLSPQGYVFV